MDYEKKYKKLVGKIEKAYLYAQTDSTKAVLEEIRHELKESEEKKVKRILNSISSKMSFHLHDIFTEEEFQCFDAWSHAWLEKQGKEKYLSEPIKDYQGSFACWNNAHDFRPKHLQRCICYDKYMKGVYCYVYDDISKYWCTQTTEEHDSDGDNHISDYADYRVPVWMPLPDISFYPSKSWLEKQGEKETLCDKCRKEHPSHSCQDITELGRCYIDGMNTANKVEPKFHEGDWVVDEEDNHVYQVKRVILNASNGLFSYDLTDNGYFYSTKSNYHLWAIQDAKDGDVLWHSDSASNGIFIFKEIRHDGKVLCYCDYDLEDHFCTGEYHTCCWSCDKYIKPATKEQRDTLFAKMKDAGYEWDAVKKELKKIEEEINGEDYGIDSLYHAQRILEKTLGKVDGYQSDDGILEHKCAISAVKKLYEQKSAWSEEDERNLQGIIDDIEANKSQAPDYDLETYDRFLSWLEKLKQRI